VYSCTFVLGTGSVGHNRFAEETMVSCRQHPGVTGLSAVFVDHMWQAHCHPERTDLQTYCVSSTGCLERFEIFLWGIAQYTKFFFGGTGVGKQFVIVHGRC
jgi:hypothetical protein